MFKLDQSIQQGRYRIRERLGQGGMGTVYLAEDQNLAGRLVAIKENADAAPDTQHQFEREAVILASLIHSNLPRVTDHFVEPSGRQYLVMDYIQGEDLRELVLKQAGPLPEAEVLAWFDQVMDALEYMHQWLDPNSGQLNCIVHRDIKPANIKRTRSGRTVLVDFGLAKDQTGNATLVGARGVSPGYSPIEQYTGGTDVRSDVYALGATLYHLLTGVKPPESTSRAAGTPLIAPRKLNPKLSRNTDRVILRALEMYASARYQSVHEMRAAMAGSQRLGLPARAQLKRAQSNSAVDNRKERQTNALFWEIPTLIIAILALLFITARLHLPLPNWWPGEATPNVRTLATPELASEAGGDANPPTATLISQVRALAQAATVTQTVVLSDPSTTPLPTEPLPTEPLPTVTAISTTNTLPLPSFAVTQSVILTPTFTPNPTSTPTIPASPTVTAMPTPTFTATEQNTETPTSIPTATPLPLPTATWTVGPTNTEAPNLTATQASNVQATIQAGIQATFTALALAMPSFTPTGTPSATPTLQPTATASATLTPTPSSTATPDVTNTPTRDLVAAAVQATLTAMAAAQPPPLTQTPTAPPTATVTPSATPTSTPTFTPSATKTLPPTATQTFIPTLIPTNTPTPSATATGTPTASATVTVRPTAIPRATTTSTPIPTPRPTLTTPPRPTPVPTRFSTNATVTLLEPLATVLQGSLTFRWSTGLALGQNQLFEMVFWPAGQDPMQQGFSPIGAQSSTAVTVNLDKAAAALPNLLIAGHDYEWGVLLVETNPYHRLQFLGGRQRFRFEYSSGGSGGGGGGGGGSGGGPAATNTPRGG